MRCIINGKTYKCEFTDGKFERGGWVGIPPTLHNIGDIIDVRYITSYYPKDKTFYDNGVMSGAEPCASLNIKYFKPINVDFKGCPHTKEFQHIKDKKIITKCSYCGEVLLIVPEKVVVDDKDLKY